MITLLFPPTIAAHVREHNILNMTAANTLREYELGQKQQKNQLKSMDRFIRGCQTNLTNFTILLANIAVNFWFYLEQKGNAPNELLIIWFLKKLSELVAQPKFREYNEKKQSKNSRLTHQNTAFLHQVLAILTEIYANFNNMDTLSAGNPFPPRPAI